MNQNTTNQQYSIHPYANALPVMSDEELNALKASIVRNGQQHPIMIYGNQVLDGRHRYQACQELGIAPVIQSWQGTDEQALAYVMAMNVNRRNLSTGQRALLAARASTLGKGQNKSRLVESDTPSAILTQEDAAKLFGVSRDTVQTARYLLNQDGDEVKALAMKLIADVEQGALSVNGAKELLSAKKAGLELLDDEREAVNKVADINARKNAKLRQKRLTTAVALNAKSQPLEPGSKKYAVILADPPWDYGDRESGSPHDIGKHYPTMKTPAICALPVQDMLTPVATLFLWCPAPKLKDGMAVMEAWGFDYVTSAVWHKKGGKQSHMGGVFRVHHEHILIGHRGGDGLPKPETKHMISSVIVAPATEHSVKPKELHEALEQYYPDFADSRIELFAREPRAGWDAWGNQADGTKVDDELLKAA